MSSGTQVKGRSTPRRDNLEPEYERDLHNRPGGARDARLADAPYCIAKRESHGRAKRGIKRMRNYR